MQTQADNLKNVISGGIETEIISVGIGDRIDENQIETIASEPKDENYILVPDFDSFDDIESQLLLALCGGTSSSVT